MKDQIKSAHIVIALLLLVAGMVFATDYAAPSSKLVQQSGDNFEVGNNRFRLANEPGLYAYISGTGVTTGTNVGAIYGITIGTAGSADSSLVLKDGTTTFATISTAAQADLTFNTALTTGTFVATTTGTTSPKATIRYR